MHEGPAGGRLALGDLVFMVREDQVLAAAVDVDLLAQILFGHDRALDVPAGPAFSPGGAPEGLAFLFRLPEHEIQRVLLLFLAGHQKGAAAAHQIVGFLEKGITKFKVN